VLETIRVRAVCPTLCCHVIKYGMDNVTMEILVIAFAISVNQIPDACVLKEELAEYSDLITDEHTHKDPFWFNTNFDQWSSVNGYFEFIKCFISTHGYKTKSSFSQLDALALLSICQNNRTLNLIFQGKGFPDLFEKVICSNVMFL